MPVDLDISDDFAVWDGAESMTFTSRRTAAGSNGDATEASVLALPAMVSGAELAPAGGVYAGYDQVWWIPAKLLSVAPKPADVLADKDGSALTVLKAELRGQRSYWRVTTRNLVLAFDLRVKVSVLRPTNAQDAAGGRVPTFAAVYSNVPARIQEVRDEEVEVFGRRGVQTVYKVYVAQQLDVTTEDLLQDAAGTKYQIVAYSDGNLIDKLPSLDAVRVP